MTRCREGTPASAQWKVSCRLIRFLNWRGYRNLEDGNRSRFPFHHDIAEGADVVVACQSCSASVTDDYAAAIFLVQRFQPRSQVDVVADDRVAHDRLRPDVACDHVP